MRQFRLPAVSTPQTENTRSTVLEAAIAVADERLVISCAGSLNRLSGLSLQSRNVSVIAIFLLLTDSVFFSFSHSFSYFFSVTVIVTVNWIIIFSVILPFQLQLTVITLVYNLTCI